MGGESYSCCLMTCMTYYGPILGVLSTFIWYITLHFIVRYVHLTVHDIAYINFWVQNWILVWVCWDYCDNAARVTLIYAKLSKNVSGMIMIFISLPRLLKMTRMFTMRKMMVFMMNMMAAAAAWIWYDDGCPSFSHSLWLAISCNIFTDWIQLISLLTVYDWLLYVRKWLQLHTHTGGGSSPQDTTCGNV